MGFDENGDEGGEILDDTHVGHVENRRFGIRIDGNDKTGPPHAGNMLDGPGYSAGYEIEVRSDRAAGDADLLCIIQPSLVTDNPGSSDERLSGRALMPLSFLMPERPNPQGGDTIKMAIEGDER